MITEEGRRLGEHWGRIGPRELDRYLVQDLEHPAYNAQSVLIRLFIIDRLFPAEATSIIEAELYYSACAVMKGFSSIACADSFSFHSPDRSEIGPCHFFRHGLINFYIQFTHRKIILCQHARDEWKSAQPLISSPHSNHYHRNNAMTSRQTCQEPS
jgi:hypothetical protein